MSLKGRLRRLARLAEDELITIAQQDGTVAKFPPGAAKDAYRNLCARMRREDVPEHPLLEAARLSSDPTWSRSFYATDGDTAGPAEDLSE